MKILRKVSNYQFIVTICSVMVSSIVPNIAYGLSPIQAGANAVQGSNQPASLFGSAGVFTIISNTMLFVIGALSVSMLIIGGLRYVISGGNTSAVTNAKNTVLYAIIGLVVALLAYAAINFVLSSLVYSSTSVISKNI